MSVIKLKEPKYQIDIYKECNSGKSDSICKSFHNFMSKKKVLRQAQLNNMKLCLKFSELGRPCPI